MVHILGNLSKIFGKLIVRQSWRWCNLAGKSLLKGQGPAGSCFLCRPRSVRFSLAGSMRASVVRGRNLTARAPFSYSGIETICMDPSALVATSHFILIFVDGHLPIASGSRTLLFPSGRLLYSLFERSQGTAAFANYHVGYVRSTSFPVLHYHSFGSA
jgi:hypothetical protein